MNASLSIAQSLRSKLPSELTGAIACGAFLLLGMLLRFVPSPHPASIAIWSALAIGLLYGGVDALQALKDRSVDIDVLMVVGAVLAAIIGQPAEGALLLFLFTLSGALEDRAMRRTMRAVEALHKLIPTRAMIWRNGAWTPGEPATLTPGDRILIRAGESVPADARIVQGGTSMDQATLTGESFPRSVGVSDEVFAGTLNVGHPVEAIVTKPAKDSSLQRVLDLVISAQQQREPFQRAIDRFSQPYAIGVMLSSLSVFAIWWRLIDTTLADAAHTAIALLIVASPCALVIATPTATLASISRGARAGLLFKGGSAVERLATMGRVFLDKTGTLTRGQARLQQVHAVAWSDGATLLAVARALESGSTHPVAVAIVEAAEARHAATLAATNLQDLPGKGLSGIVTLAGRPVRARLGTAEHCEEIVAPCLRARTRDVLEAIRARGQIGVVVAIEDAIPETSPSGPEPVREAGQAAVLILSDTIRSGAEDFVHALHDLDIAPVHMVTGDHALTAASVSSTLGLDGFDAGLMPEDKVRIVREAREAAHRATRRFKGVGVVGDGVNDAPALAAADVSIAIGTIGSDAALESADIVLLNDDLAVIPWGVRLARRTRAIIRFNLALALGVMACMAVATLVGSRTAHHIPLPLAVAMHEGSTLFVVANSLRLLLVRAPTGARDSARHSRVDEVPSKIKAA